MCPGINAKEYQEASGTEEAEEPGTAWNKNLPGMWQGICTKNRKAGVLRISVPKSENTKNGIDLEIESRSKGKSEKSREKEAKAEIHTCRYKHQGKGNRNNLWKSGITEPSEEAEHRNGNTQKADADRVGTEEAE